MDKEITLGDLIKTREDFRSEQKKLFVEIGNKELVDKIFHVTFKIKSWSRRIENKIHFVLEEQRKSFKIRQFISDEFQNNDGYDSNVPFKLKIQGIEYIHIDSHYNKDGITRFQGIIITKYDTPCMPAIELLPYIDHWQLLTIYEGKIPCITIWFKQPITQELIDKDIEIQAIEKTKKLF